MTSTTEKKLELQLIKKPSGVALIMFDSAAKYNALGSQVRMELDQNLDYALKDDAIKAVICISGKSDNFIIGADLPEIRRCDNREEILSLSRKGQVLLNKLAGFPKPVIAAINGSCLGGGLELALACHARVASNDKRTVFAMPETRLGLIPGLGGTQRLPALIGLKAALDLILSTNPINAEQALEYGLIDELVSPDDLIDKAERHALALCDSEEWKSKASTVKASDGVKASRHCKVPLEADKAQKLLAISERAIKLRTRGNYPAQTEAIRVIREGLNNGIEKGLELEAEVFANLATGEIASNLINLFFNTDFAKASAQNMVQKVNGSQVKTLGLVGAGVMGIGLAQLASAAGIKVILKTNPDKMPSVKEELRQIALRSVKKTDSPEEKEAIVNSIVESVSLVSDEKDLEAADLILECIIEDEAAKKTLLTKLSKLKETIMIATGTSSLSVTKLSSCVGKPENFVGIHFFHPVGLMPLVELISTAGTAKQTLARAMDLVLKLEKTPIVVKDSPGFLINRLLTIYLFELARLAEEKTPLNWVEETMIEYGMPMGPLQLMDEIGIDVSFSVANILEEGFGERLKSPEIFHKVRAIGLQGKRSNFGFYLWENSEKRLGINPEMLEKTGAIHSDQKCPEEEKNKITERMLFPMIDEAARCLQEKVIARPREIDFALILGTGFPAFRGGLLRYADTKGLRYIVKTLEEIYASSAAKGSASKREVSELLKKYAAEGRGFYSSAGAKEE